MELFTYFTDKFIVISAFTKYGLQLCRIRQQFFFLSLGKRLDKVLQSACILPPWRGPHHAKPDGFSASGIFGAILFSIKMCIHPPIQIFGDTRIERVVLAAYHINIIHPFTRPVFSGLIPSFLVVRGADIRIISTYLRNCK